MALLNEAIAPGVLTHIADHDVISRVVNERHGVNVINPVAGQHYAPDMALGETHVINLPAAGVVTLDAPVSTDPVRAWLPGAELVIVLVSPAGSTASVAWAAAYAAGGAPVPQAGSSVVGRWRNITSDASPAVWVPAAAPSGAFAGDLRAMSLSSTDVALVAKGFAGQSADIQQWQNSAGTALAKVDNAGNVVTTQSLVGGAVQAPSFTGPQISMGSTGITIVNRTAIANVVAAFKGLAGQTGDLTQWQDSTGAVLAAFKSSGGLWVTPPTNPSVVVGNAANLANGFAFLGHVTTAGTWFTDTAVNEGVFAANLTAGKRLHVGKSSGTAGLTPLSLSDEVAQVVAIFKGQASQSGDLTRWQNSAAATLARVSSDGSLSTGAGAEANGSQLAAYISNAARAGLVVRAAASQTADLGDWQNSAGINVTRVDANGAVWAIGGSGFGQAALVGGSATGAGYLAWFGPNGNRLGYMGNNGNAATNDQGTVSINTGTFLMAATAAASVATIIRGAVAATGDLTEWQDSTGAVLTRIGATGGAVMTGPAAWMGAQVNASSAQAGWPAIVARGFAAQTADLQQWQDSTAAVLAYVNSNGRVSGNKGLAALGIDPGTGVGLYVAPGVAGSVSSLFKAAASQTADLTQWQNSGGTVLSKVDANGNAFINAVYIGSGGASVGGSQASIVSPAATQIAFAIKAAASQSADLTRWLDSAGTIKAFVRNDGQIQSNVGIVVGSQATGSGGGAGGAMTSQSPAANQVAMIAKGASGQTAALHEWQNSAGTVKAYIDATGVVGSQGSYGANVAAFSADLRNSASTASIGLYVTMQSGQAGDAIDIGTSTGSQVARITSSGNVQGTGAYTTLSDASAKTNVRGLVHDPLDVIRRLTPRHFDYRGEMFGGERDQVGFVAQELQAVLPQAVVAFDDRLGTRSEAIVAYLVAAVQELDRRLAA